jgi:CarD family transcriptional regulator
MTETAHDTRLTEAQSLSAQTPQESGPSEQAAVSPAAEAPAAETVTHEAAPNTPPGATEDLAAGPELAPADPIDSLVDVPGDEDVDPDLALGPLDPLAGLVDVPGDDDADPEALGPDALESDALSDVDLVEEDDEDDVEELPKASNRVAPRMPGHMPGVPNRPVMHARLPSKAEIFVEGDHVVYPTHGVGKVERIATEEIAGHKLELIHITFEENRMTLRVPVAKARSAGLRKLATRKMFDEAMAVLKGRARIKRTMWSRRAQEYEAKINSGDPLAIAEVVRDLHRNAGQPDQSFSERQIYEAAMDRLAAELAALDKTDKMTAVTKLGDFLKAA